MNVLVEGAVDSYYPTSVAAGFRVTVPVDRAAEAQQLLSRAEHTDPADPTSSLDVGLPVDEDVRDYLAWKGAGKDVHDEALTSEFAPENVPATMTGQKAAGLPVLPMLMFAALVVALVVWLR